MLQPFREISELPIMLSAHNLSMALGISKSNAYMLMRQEDFPSIKIGKRVLVQKDSFRAWLKTQES